MAKKVEGPKVELERDYVVPLRKGWLKVPKYKRANKAVKTLKEFIAQHMKVYDRDLRKIRVEMTLNNELRFRGMRKPPARIRVKAKKFSDGIVRVDLVDFPEHVKFAKIRAERKGARIREKVEAKVEEKGEVEDENVEESKEAKENEASAKEESLKLAKESAKEIKHISKGKQIVEHRKALSK